MKCDNCGFEIAAGADRCANCGAPSPPILESRDIPVTPLTSGERRALLLLAGMVAGLVLLALGIIMIGGSSGGYAGYYSRGDLEAGLGLTIAGALLVNMVLVSLVVLWRR